MRSFKILMLGASMLAGAAQAAADKPVIGPAPDWVKPVALPKLAEKPDEAPIRLLLSDQQVKLEPDAETLYSDIAVHIQTPQGLSAGNLSFPWNPETDVFSVHKLIIRRGSETIDVLASGQSFTVVRREPNLENAMLDGVLTANIQPEGLQVGDILEFAVSMRSSDPVLKGHVEQIGAGWNGLPISRAHFRAQWPSSLPVAMRQTSALPATKIVKAGGTSSIELSLDDIEPIIPPKHAPVRYAIGRVIELSNFKSWADLGALMAPLYAKAATIPADGPLRTELEKIKAALTDPVKRAEAALTLVQDRVRYVALLMGAGGYVPADATETWSRRFGDCKAKTALLLALLKDMGIAAEPVAANLGMGDGIDQRLPMIGLFNHVLVRATIDGKSYWMDGTRSGDASLARLRVPDFGWGLPLVPTGAQLVKMQPPALEQPDEELVIDIDARKGLSIPAPIKASTVLRGDSAMSTKLGLAGMTADVRDRALRDYWKSTFDFVEVKAVTASFDAATGEQRLTMEGSAAMEWKDGWYETDKTGLGFKADLSRPAGANLDAPYMVNYPSFSRTIETIMLPPGFPEAKDLPNAKVDETVGGVEYRRHAQIVDNVFRIEASARSLMPEFPAKDAPTAEKRLRDMAEDNVYLRRPRTYRLTQAELDASLATTPKTASAFVDRGNQFMDAGRFGDALKDFDEAVKLDPKYAIALADRGVARAWLQDFDLATKDLDAAAAIEPKSVVVFRGRGIVAQGRGDSKGAVEAYSQALALDANDNFSLGHRAEAYRAAGDDAAALADATATLKANPAWIDMYLLRANVYRAQGKREDALAEATALTEANAGNAWAYVVAARIQSSFGERSRAMQALDRALALQPEPFIYLNRAEIREKSDVEGRQADFDAALKINPGMVEAIVGKGRLLADKGDLPGAIALYSKALTEKPTDPSFLLSRGIAYARSGDKVKADKDFTAARDKAQGSGPLNNLCWSKAIAGVALETALTECDAALAKQPDASAIIDSKAFVLLRLGRFDEAIAAYDAALVKRPRQSSSLFGRAVAWARKGDKAKADADLAAALAVDPEVQTTFADYGVKF